MISTLLRTLISTLSSHEKLALENLALRQQIVVLRRSVKRPHLKKSDQVFWTLQRAPAGKHGRKMFRRMNTCRGKQHYRKRKWIVEPVFGWIKSATNFRSFSLRGSENVRGEWNLVCFAADLRRLNGKMQWT